MQIATQQATEGVFLFYNQDPGIGTKLAGSQSSKNADNAAADNHDVFSHAHNETPAIVPVLSWSKGTTKK